MQTSTKNLSITDEEHLLDQFYSLLADFSSPQEIQTFLVSFMTPTERIVFAKRLEIALLLHRGKSYDEISKKLNVSSATISSISENRDTDGVKLALQRLNLEAWAEKTVNRLLFWNKHDK